MNTGNNICQLVCFTANYRCKSPTCRWAHVDRPLGLYWIFCVFRVSISSLLLTIPSFSPHPFLGIAWYLNRGINPYVLTIAFRCVSTACSIKKISSGVLSEQTSLDCYFESVWNAEYENFVRSAQLMHIFRKKKCTLYQELSVCLWNALLENSRK